MQLPALSGNNTHRIHTHRTRSIFPIHEIQVDRAQRRKLRKNALIELVLLCASFYTARLLLSKAWSTYLTTLISRSRPGAVFARICSNRCKRLLADLRSGPPIVRRRSTDSGCAHRLSCASNTKNLARHTWDRRSPDGKIGAVTSVVVPWLIDQQSRGVSWEAMAWWIHDHLPYSDLQFFPKMMAFNIGWHQAPKRTIYSFIQPRGFLTKPGFANHGGDHAHLYPGFPDL